jgi:branched-chain amino acid transport system ATP-binding protein
VTEDLRIEALTLRFGGLTVLNEFSSELKRGELVGLVGPNGAGKTSLINCITGLYHASQGRVVLGDVDLTGLAPHNIVASGISRTFQQVHLVPDLSVEENLLLARQHLLKRSFLWSFVYYGPARTEERGQRRAIGDALEIVGIGHLRHRPVSDLTLWEQKLVTVARALCSEPKVLLLDEPAGGLAATEKHEFVELILRLKRESGITQVVVEHDMEMLQGLCDRLIVMNAGALLADGEPREVLRRPEVVEAYIGAS